MSFSKIVVMGNLTKDPNLNYTPKGTAVCTINIANNERERDSKTGEQTDRVTFFKATAWGKQAEAIATYFERGSEIYIEGKFRPEAWTDKEGRERVTFGISHGFQLHRRHKPQQRTHFFFCRFCCCFRNTKQIFKHFAHR